MTHFVQVLIIVFNFIV